jgi:hypothetical protein
MTGQGGQRGAVNKENRGKNKDYKITMCRRRKRLNRRRHNEMETKGKHEEDNNTKNMEEGDLREQKREI